MTTETFTTSDKAAALTATLRAWQELHDRAEGQQFGYFVPPGWGGRVLNALREDLELQAWQEALEEEPQASAPPSPRSTVIRRPSSADIQWALRAMQMLGDMSERTSRKILEVLIGPLDEGEGDGS